MGRNQESVRSTANKLRGAKAKKIQQSRHGQSTETGEDQENCTEWNATISADTEGSTWTDAAHTGKAEQDTGRTNQARAEQRKVE